MRVQDGNMCAWTVQRVPRPFLSNPLPYLGGERWFSSEKKPFLSCRVDCITKEGVLLRRDKVHSTRRSRVLLAQTAWAADAGRRQATGVGVLEEPCLH